MFLVYLFIFRKSGVDEIMQALFVFVVTLVRLFLHSFFACVVAFLFARATNR